MPSTLRRWGLISCTLFNVGKGTKKYFSVQIGSQIGVSREQTPVN